MIVTLFCDGEAALTKKPILSLMVCGLFLVVGLVAGVVSPSSALDSRLSGAVALVFKGNGVESFLRAPGLGYVQAYMRFPSDFPEDVIVALDQEFIEGVQSPLYVKGGDWMGFVGFQRTGSVWVAAGTDDTMKGKPSTDRDWKILSLGKPFEPEQWYKIRILVDFKSRYFVNVQVDGPNIVQTLDLSSYKLDYPNYASFDKASLSYYVIAMRGRSMMQRKGVPLAFFDDVEGGIVDSQGRDHAFFKDGFEKQHSVEDQPVTVPVIKQSRYQQGKWYKERSETLVAGEEASFAHSGSFVGVANAELE
ncbi:MAG: hypothetical protein AB7E52_02490 [Bdellovibrionales bacterium]